ncbi:MAG TPA: class I SAM-dependent methyltransferase [Thermoanaerobaculia bacterium]|nr:class I SAM-dependent methyltransferase [Thermoanaerobaculia bacterium]
MHPVPDEDVLACFYTSDYAYYQDAGRHPDREARSWKYRVARWRYRALLSPGALHSLAALLAVLTERLTRKSITFTLGVPLTLSKNARILDYGYGTGSWLLSMRRLGYSHLLGYDIAANAHRRDELAAEGIQVIPPGGLSSLEPASLDCVRLEHVFEHLADPLAVLRSLRRLLRPGGLLVMTFPTIYPWLEMEDLESSPFRPYLQLPIHLTHHSVESSRGLLAAAGFEGVLSRITARERFITLMARGPADGGS